jgi:hypothetical protein
LGERQGCGHDQYCSHHRRGLSRRSVLNANAGPAHVLEQLNAPRRADTGQVRFAASDGIMGAARAHPIRQSADHSIGSVGDPLSDGGRAHLIGRELARSQVHEVGVSWRGRRKRASSRLGEGRDGRALRGRVSPFVSRTVPASQWPIVIRTVRRRLPSSLSFNTTGGRSPIQA